jgi:hypothetical protein
MANLVYRISGMLACECNIPFEVTYDNGTIIIPDETSSSQAFQRLFYNRTSFVNSIIAELVDNITSPVHVITPVAGDNNINDWTLCISGIIGDDDRSVRSFGAIRQNGFSQMLGDRDGYKRAVGRRTLLAAINALWERLVGMNNIDELPSIIADDTIFWCDQSSIYQDTGKTIPATEVGDPVKVWADKSGFGSDLVLTLGSNTTDFVITERFGGTAVEGTLPASHPDHFNNFMAATTSKPPYTMWLVGGSDIDGASSVATVDAIGLTEFATGYFDGSIGAVSNGGGSALGRAPNTGQIVPSNTAIRSYAYIAPEDVDDTKIVVNGSLYNIDNLSPIVGDTDPSTLTWADSTWLVGFYNRYYKEIVIASGAKDDQTILDVSNWLAIKNGIIV